MTLPELVTDYRVFAEQVVSALQQAAQNEGAITPDRVRLIVGIDEIDRIESAEKAEKFINEIKSIFGRAASMWRHSLPMHWLSLNDAQ